MNADRWKGLAVLAGSLLIVVMDITILNVALPELIIDLRPDSIQVLWIVDTYAIVIAGFLVTMSAIGDRWGRRRMLIAGYLVFGGASLLVLFVRDPWMLVALRAALGVGGAMIMPSTLSMIRELFPDPAERATALGVWGATAGIGAGVGPILGGALLEFFPWQSAFLVNVPVMLIAIVAALRVLPESVVDRAGPLDWPATAASIVGMVALVYAIKHFSKDGFTVHAIVAAAVGLVALTWFVYRCLHRPDPLLDLRLLRDPSFSASLIAAVVASAGIAGIMLLGSQWLQLVRGYSALGAGFALLPCAFGGAIASVLAPAVAQRSSVRAVLAGALVVGGCGFALFFITPKPLGLGPALFAFLLIGIGLGALAIGSAVLMARSPPERAGNAAAMEEVAYDVGATLGVAVLGSVAAAVYRGGLPDLDLPPGAEEAVRESLAGAFVVAAQLGAPGAALIESASAAFTSSLGAAGAVGAAMMLAAAVAVWRLVPHDLNITGGGH